MPSFTEGRTSGIRSRVETHAVTRQLGQVRWLELPMRSLRRSLVAFHRIDTVPAHASACTRICRAITSSHLEAAAYPLVSGRTGSGARGGEILRARSSKPRTSSSVVCEKS